MRILAASLTLIGMLAAAPAVEAQSHDQYGRAYTIECKSKDYHFTRCAQGWRDVRLVEQISDTRCVEGRTYGVDREGLWVDGGCAGIFERGGAYRRDERDHRDTRDDRDHRDSRDDHDDYDDHDSRDRHESWSPGADWDQDIRFRCKSKDYSYTFCAVDVGHGGSVRLTRQVSDTHCGEGSTWGWNRAGVWVDRGCDGEFVIERRWR